MTTDRYQARERDFSDGRRRWSVVDSLTGAVISLHPNRERAEHHAMCRNYERVMLPPALKAWASKREMAIEAGL